MLRTAGTEGRALRSQLELRRMFEGLRSRWMTLAECMYLSAHSICCIGGGGGES